MRRSKQSVAKDAGGLGNDGASTTCGNKPTNWPAVHVPCFGLDCGVEGSRLEMLFLVSTESPMA